MSKRMHSALNGQAVWQYANFLREKRYVATCGTGAVGNVLRKFSIFL